MNCKKQSCTSEKQAPEKGNVSPEDKQCQPEAHTRYLVLRCTAGMSELLLRCLQIGADRDPLSLQLLTGFLWLMLWGCQFHRVRISALLWACSQGSLVVALSTRDRLLACLSLVKMQISAKGTKGKNWYHLFFRLLVSTLKITISIAYNFPNLIWAKFSCGRRISWGAGCGREFGSGGDCNQNKTAQTTEPFSRIIECFGIKGTLNIS